MADGGVGPGDWAALLNVGAYTTNASAGCWLLAIDPPASNLMFIAQSEGTNQIVFDAPIDFDAGDWHNLCVTYTETNCCLYLEGQIVTNAGPIVCWPSVSQCLQDGLFVGSASTSGQYQCRGQMQYLTTFDSARSAGAVADDYASVSAFIAYWGGSLPSLGGGFHSDSSGGPPAPPGFTNSGGGGGQFYVPCISPPSAGSNLFLFISEQTNFVIVTLTNTVPGLPYILFSSTNVAGHWMTNWITNQYFPQAPAGKVIVAQPMPASASVQFYRAVQAAPVPGTLRWKTLLSDPNLNPGDSFGKGLDASPALSPDGTTIYIASSSNLLFAVDSLTGNVKWQDYIFTNTTRGPSEPTWVGATLVGANGKIYVGYNDGNCYSINSDGSTNWISSAGGDTAVLGTPALGTNGVIYVPTDEATYATTNTGLSSFNTTANGSTNWLFKPQYNVNWRYSDINSSPAVGSDGTIYFLAEGFRLWAMTPGGNVKWYLPVASHAEPDSSVAIASDGTLYVGSASPYLYAVNPDGSVKWIFNASAVDSGNPSITSSPAIGPDGTIYFGTGSIGDGLSGPGNLYALNPDGSLKWVFTNPTQSTISSPAIASDGTVYIGSADWNLYAVSNGSLAWSFLTTYNSAGLGVISSPLIANDGTVIFASEDGYLYAVWGSAPLATNAPWPTFHQNPARTGLQSPPTSPVEDCGAPFLSNGTNDGHGNFTFTITGSTNNLTARWSVYASTNLTTWTVIATGVALNTNMNTYTTNFTDTNVTGMPMRFYELSTNNCCSRAIGFVNLTIARGTNLIADQLSQVDDDLLTFQSGNGYFAPMNTLTALFLDSWGSTQSPTQIFKWSGTNFDGAAYDNYSGPEWLPSPSGGDMTLLPGSSVLLNNETGKSFTNSFVGLLREEQIVQIQTKTNYLSATLPVAGPITTVTGYVPHNGDTIQLWSTNASNFVSHTYSSNTWSNGVPVLAVGQGFVLITTNTYTWTNTWQNFQPCP